VTYMNLGKLQRLPLRRVWPHEASDFTTWLSQKECLKSLGEAVDINLELETIEQSVGPYFADIICKDLSDNSLVLIENQLEFSDHKHLGQLLTYAAGIEAATVIWITSEFTEQHRAALDWLNRITDVSFKFFGIEIQLWQIDDSLPAPKFNVTCSPNLFTKSTRPPGDIIKNEFTHRYWDAFSDYLSGQSIDFGWLLPRGKGHNWCSYYRKRRVSPYRGIDYHLGIGSGDHWIGTEIFFCKEVTYIFDQLESQKDAIELELPKLEWKILPSKDKYVGFFRTDLDPADESTWPDQHTWLFEKSLELHKILGPKIDQLLQAQEATT
jgi:Domain of unknown function (DUF4268)